jgi:hypothetical protein
VGAGLISVLTPTVPGREELLLQCVASVQAAGLEHHIQLDERGEGPAVVRNRLAERVDTEWLLCLDDDDLLLSHYLEVVEPSLADSDVVYTKWYLTGAVDPQPLDVFDPILLRQRNFIPVTACVRTSLFRQVGGFNPNAVLEDHDLWVRLLDAGARFTFVPVVCWRYRRRPGSRTETENSR